MKISKLISVSAALVLSTQLFADYHALINNKQEGPFSVETLKQMSKDGKISKSTLVWEDGMSGWESASKQDALKSIFASPPPPPSIAPPPPPPINTDTSIDETQNELSSADALPPKKISSLSDWQKEFEDKFQVKIGQTEDGKTFFFGESVVRVGPLDPAYGKELTLTYDKAMLNLQANFILQTYGDSVAMSVADEFFDDSTNANEFTPVKLKAELKASNGQVSNIIDKVLDVVENKLDKILVDQGVPESEIQKQTVEQKKLLAKDNFSKQMAKKAFASMSGLVPVQTKILTTERNGKKSVKVGVIAIMSEKTVQFSRDIAKRRSTSVSGRPSNIKAILPATENGYLDEIGLRYIYDKQGRPMLLSYGRWAVVGKTDNAARYERKIQNAKEKARMFAESYIGEFMTSNINAAQSADIDSVSEEVAKKISTIENNKVANEQESREDLGETLDKSFKKLEKSSKFKLRGTSQVSTWEATDKNGMLHVGSVITWSYSQLENANNIVKSSHKKSKKVEKKPAKKASNVSRESRVVNTMDDF